MSQKPEITDLIRMPAGMLGAIRDVLRRDGGDLQAAQLMREMGLASGGAFYNLLRDSLAGEDGATRDPEELESHEFWSRLGGFFSDLGWGRLEHEQMAEGVFALTALDWAEAADYSDGADCHFTSGLLAEILHRLAGQDLAVLQVERSEAEDGSCRFIVGSPDTVEAVFMHIRDGAAYPDAIEAVTVAR